MRALTILVVDDEPQIRRAVRNALESGETRVLEAPTGAEALNVLAAEKPDLIVLDLGLPDKTGIEVCRELRGWSDSCARSRSSIRARSSCAEIPFAWGT